PISMTSWSCRCSSPRAPGSAARRGGWWRASTSPSPRSLPCPWRSRTVPASCPTKPCLTWACSRSASAFGVAWKVWKTRRRGDTGEQPEPEQGGPAVLKVATTTFANGGDNIGVYVPVFTNVGTSETIVYAVVFLVLVGVWCAAGWFAASRPVIARPLARWGDILLPVVLITIGLLILIEGGAFGL